MWPNFDQSCAHMSRPASVVRGQGAALGLVTWRWVAQCLSCVVQSMRKSYAQVGGNHFHPHTYRASFPKLGVEIPPEGWIGVLGTGEALLEVHLALGVVPLQYLRCVGGGDPRLGAGGDKAPRAMAPHPKQLSG